MADFWKRVKTYPMSKVNTGMANHVKFYKKNSIVRDVPVEKELKPFVVPPKEKQQIKN